MSASTSEIAEPRAPMPQTTNPTARSAAESESEPARVRFFPHLRNVIRPWLLLCTALAAVLPDFTFPRLRSGLLRAAGVDAAQGVAMMGRIKLVGSGSIAGRLHIGEGTVIAPGVTFGLDGEITLGKNVSVGPGVTVYTATHPIGYGSQRMLPYTSARSIVIGDGVWIGMNSLILPGVTLGRGSVVSAGSVVTENVAANALVSGNPAAVRATLPFGDR